MAFPNFQESAAMQATLAGGVISDAPSRSHEVWIGDDLVMFASNSIGLMDPTTEEINVYKTKTKPHRLNESDFFLEYRRLLFESGIVSVLVRFLTEEIAGSSYYFDGEDPEKVKLVKDFWYTNNIYDKLEEIVLQTILMGTGVGFSKKTKGRISTEKTDGSAFRRVDVTTVTIERDQKTGKEKITQEGVDITKNAFLLRFFRYPDTVWGISLARPVLVGIQGLDDLFRDIPPAIKQLAYVDRILKLDLSSIADPDERKKILTAARDAFKEYDSSTTTVIVMSETSDLGYMGTLGGSSGGMRRIDPILPIVEPILVFILLSFNVPLGEVLQTGANKAIIRDQKTLATKRVNTLRQKFAREVERQIIAPLLGEEGIPSVRVRYLPDPMTPTEEADFIVRGWEIGLLTREESRKKLGFPGEITGTFVYETPVLIRKNIQTSIRINKDAADEDTQKLIDDLEEPEQIDESKTDKTKGSTDE